jgi:proline dehydrogenase
MMRSLFLYLSRQPTIFKFVRRNRLARAFASRFVAGETADEAIKAVAALNAKGISTSLDLLGESVHNEAEARAAGRAYLDLLDQIAAAKVDGNVSLKLTQMGFDLNDDLCVSIVSEILDKAKATSSFVRLDMESSEYTQRTIDLFATRLHPKYPKEVGVVLQSMLRRTRDDVESAIRNQVRVRLCKGAYLEPEKVAFPDKKDVDANYVTCMKALLERGNYAGIATHDEKIIEETIRFAREHKIAPDRFEFQMLYGVRRDLQERLVQEGWRMRVYVPFGSQWYPYLMRRLAERPANVAFITMNIVREAFGGRRRAAPPRIQRSA